MSTVGHFIVSGLCEQSITKSRFAWKAQYQRMAHQFLYTGSFVGNPKSNSRRESLIFWSRFHRSYGETSEFKQSTFSNIYMCEFSFVLFSFWTPINIYGGLSKIFIVLDVCTSKNRFFVKIVQMINHLYSSFITTSTNQLNFYVSFRKVINDMFLMEHPVYYLEIKSSSLYLIHLEHFIV